MRHFISIKDVENLPELVNKALDFKKDPWKHAEFGKHKTLGLIFLNPSLRTRLSTQKAAQTLGMSIMLMNFDNEGWALETEEGVVMKGTSAEHVKEGAAVVGQYCDIIGVRSFPKLRSRDEDYSDVMLSKFIQYANVPIVSLESSILHPLQSLTDLMTIEEYRTVKKPKVVLTWVPHFKSLPQAVPNSFAEWMNHPDANVDFVITHPPGYELAEQFRGKAEIIYDQNEALKDADFVYAKNWSSYHQYGKVLTTDSSWVIDNSKMDLTNNGKFMHCLPLRRNLKVMDEVLDGPQAIHIQQAANRVHAAQAVLKKMLEDNF
ncbi:N-acetylornithine carbamoyltransferase [Cytophagaceae bacterium ABcell3]|nr:N-acetylornithine carbamoyltransferase [Cytophagaceae bacterium ABcell3]